MGRFGGLPNWWHRDESLYSALKADKVGEGIAAMKCLLALSVLVDFYTKDVEVSISDLMLITGLSRPMVIRGVDKLEAEKVVSIDKSSYKNVYKLLTVDTDDNWAKVPVGIIRKRLKTISNRGIAPFSALKIYLALLGYRYKTDVVVTVSHQTLVEKTKLQPAHIRQGLDVLYCSSMIHVVFGEMRTPNRYKILGL